MSKYHRVNVQFYSNVLINECCQIRIHADFPSGMDNFTFKLALISTLAKLYGSGSTQNYTDQYFFKVVFSNDLELLNNNNNKK